MDERADILRKFSFYRREKYLTANEYARICDIFENNDDAVPDWLEQLESLCGLAYGKLMGEAEFARGKARIFARRGNARIQMPMPKAGKNSGDEAINALRKDTAGIARNCALAAALIGLFPLPVSDAPFLVVTQYVMLKKLCSRYGRKPGLALFLIVLTALAGPVIFNAFIKLVPGVGSIAGACVAGGLTWYIGAKTRAMLEKGLDFSLSSFLAVKINEL